jgi:hypothetical protein
MPADLFCSWRELLPGLKVPHVEDVMDVFEVDDYSILLVLYEATKNSVKEWKTSEDEALRETEFDDPSTPVMTSEVIKDVIKEGAYAESLIWKVNEEDDTMQQGVAVSNDSKELGCNAKVTHKDTLKFNERLEYFRQQDDILYSDVVQLKKLLSTVKKKVKESPNKILVTDYLFKRNGSSLLCTLNKNSPSLSFVSNIILSPFFCLS